MKAKKPAPEAASPPRKEVNYADIAAAEMRTNIIMEGPLVAEAQAITGIKTKTGVVHYALREVVRREKMKEIFKMRGKVAFWDGYVEEHVNP